MPALAHGEIDRPDLVIRLCSQSDLKLKASAAGAKSAGR